MLNLLYVDYVVLFANTLGDVQKLMKAFEKFACILRIYNYVSRALNRDCACKEPNIYKAWIIYTDESLSFVESFI